MFTEENNEYWRKFSRLINSGFEERKYWHSAKALYDYKEFRIVFGNYAITTVSGNFSLEDFVTRVYCRINSKEDISFKIVPKKFSNRILNLFNKKQVLSDIEFCEKFIFISNNEKISRILTPPIFQLIQSVNVAEIGIGTNEGIWGDELESGAFELYIYLDEFYPDYKNLKLIKELFETILDKLKEAYLLA